MSYKFIKRLFDIILGLLAIIVMIPIFLFVKFMFLCSGDTGNILYYQERIGKNGKKFKMMKFRSMVQNADEMLEELLKDERYKKEWEANQKIENDPRITKIGRILRKSSMDEMPQLWNVLIGDMSLVGPRPLVEGELESHGGSDFYWKVKPGITGWWACHGRSNLKYAERLELEYYYIRNCSLKLDLICIYKTVFAILQHKGAM